MELLDFTKSTAAGREKIAHHGTFNGGPLSAAAGIATLGLVASTDACVRANDYAARLREELNRVLRDEQVPWIAVRHVLRVSYLYRSRAAAPRAAEIESGKLDYRILKNSASPLADRQAPSWHAPARRRDFFLARRSDVGRTHD